MLTVATSLNCKEILKFVALNDDRARLRAREPSLELRKGIFSIVAVGLLPREDRDAAFIDSR